MAAETRILSKEEQDKVHELCLEAEVLVELAGSVAALVMRNYIYPDREIPKHINEMYERSVIYTQSVLGMQTLEELHRVSDELIGYREIITDQILKTFGKVC